MKKIQAKFNFILTTLLLVIAIFLCFAQFNLPSNNQYNGLFNSISATSEITNGNSAVYKIMSEDVTDEEINQTVEKIRSILNGQGFVGSKVYRQGDYIKAEVEAKSNATSILSIIGDSSTFYISSKDQETITAEELATYDIVNTEIKNAYYTTTVNLNQEYNGVTIEFTQAGAEKLKELTKQVNATETPNVYFYIDGTKSTSLEVEETTNNYLSFYSSSYTQDMAQEYALQILMSSTGVQLKTISNSETTATLGNNVLLITMLAVALILLISLIVLPILFGDLGFVANLSVLFGAVFTIFILQALPLTTGSVATIFGALLGLAIQVICHIIYLNKIKSEFTALNRMQLAAKTGFKKSWLINLDICVMSFIGSLSLIFWNIPFVSTFAIGLAVGSFVALFTTMLMLKDFVTWYVTINPKNYKRVKFTKGEINE
ncbi:MAG: hypothetical protein E7376_00725 [Clostridiales bacterium]|nr:hypothetical protein [Clostridiales bacterium]